MSENEAPLVDFQWLIDSDTDGLLDTPEKPKKVTSNDRLERAFAEIVEFRRFHGHLPSSTTREIAERKLGARLDGILASESKIAALRHLDEFGMLEMPEAPESIDDLLAADDFDLLGDDSGLLDVSGLPARKAPDAPESVARRTRAIGFEEFESLFKTKHAELAEGVYRLMPFPGRQTITAGNFFVLNGVMLFIAEVGETEYKKSTVRENKRERLRCIFENGTESDMYRQSLMTRMYEAQGQVLARTGVGQVQAVFIDQHRLVAQPVGPGLFAHVFPDSLAELAGVGRKVESFGFGAELDAVDHACHRGLLKKLLDELDIRN